MPIYTFLLLLAWFTISTNTPACRDGKATNSLLWDFYFFFKPYPHSPDKDLHNKTFNLSLISDYIWAQPDKLDSATVSSWSFGRRWFTSHQLACCHTCTTYSAPCHPCLNAYLRASAIDSGRVWFGDSLSGRGRDTKQGPWLPGQARPCQLHRGLQCSRALGRGRLAPDQLPQWILFLSLAFSYRKAEPRWRLLLNPVGLSCHCGSAALSNRLSTDTKWHSFANICASCPLPTSRSKRKLPSEASIAIEQKKKTPVALLKWYFALIHVLHERIQQQCFFVCLFLFFSYYHWTEV